MDPPDAKPASGSAAEGPQASDKVSLGEPEGLAAGTEQGPAEEGTAESQQAEEGTAGEESEEGDSTAGAPPSEVLPTTPFLIQLQTFYTARGATLQVTGPAGAACWGMYGGLETLWQPWRASQATACWVQGCTLGRCLHCVPGGL